jgi:hypothetical protein
VNVSPEGSGNITAPEFTDPPTAYPVSFTCNTTYTLTAVPDAGAGYAFIDWTVNGAIVTGNPLAVSVVDGAKSVIAYFRMTNTPNDPPNADAGDSRDVTEGSLVTLDGSGSFDPNNDIRKYLWEQTGGPAITLSSAAAVSPTFTAPAVLASEGPTTLTFRLTVEDVLGETDTDTVTITVVDSGNDPPTADAGDDQTVTEADLVTLDASGSFDPNGDDDITIYLWEQTEGPIVALSDTSAVNPTFTAPYVEVDEDPMKLAFKLVITDSVGLTSEDTVTITVRRGPIGGDSSNAACFISGAAR